MLYVPPALSRFRRTRCFPRVVVETAADLDLSSLKKESDRMARVVTINPFEISFRLLWHHQLLTLYLLNEMFGALFLLVVFCNRTGKEVIFAFLSYVRRAI